MLTEWECKNCKLSSGYPMIIEPCRHGSCSVCLSCRCPDKESIRPNYTLGHQLEKQYVPPFFRFKSDKNISKFFIFWLLFMSAFLSFLFYVALHYYLVYPLVVRENMIHETTCTIVNCTSLADNLANVTYMYKYVSKSAVMDFNCTSHNVTCYYDCLENLTLDVSNLVDCYISPGILEIAIIVSSVIIFILTSFISIYGACN